MPVELNHTIVAARDAEAAARWFAEMFSVEPPFRVGHFWQVSTANGVALDFVSTGDPFSSQHYAFLVGESDFDAIFGRIHERGIEHWADPSQHRPGQINHHDGGRGV